MSNAELIAHARDVNWQRHHNEKTLLMQLADALEEADRKIARARTVFANSEEDEDVSDIMDVLLA